jgi:hypothetical protein
MSLTKRSAMFQRWLDEQDLLTDSSDYDYLEYTYFQQLQSQRIERKACSTDSEAQDDTAQSRRQEEVQPQTQKH